METITATATTLLSISFTRNADIETMASVAIFFIYSLASLLAFVLLVWLAISNTSTLFLGLTLGLPLLFAISLSSQGMSYRNTLSIATSQALYGNSTCK